MVGLCLANLIGAATVVGVARAAEAPTDLPSNLHGSVETQAITDGNGALALFVDPGTAYAYSTFDRDDYGAGSVSYTMTARGANLNLGTIAYAVIWAAPDCSADGNYGCIASGGEGTPNTGMHEAAGFPLYAEALYPPPPPEAGASREHVYKCVVNKDAPGEAPTGGAAGDVCKTSDGVPFSSWAEAPGDELRSTGFSRVAGFATPVVSVGGSESHSDVRYVGEDIMRSSGKSAVTDISILDGQITIESSSVRGFIESGGDGVPKRGASCTFSGVSIGGQEVAIKDIANGDAQKLLDGVRDATGYEVKIIPPSPVELREDEGGKQVAACRGVQVFITDLHQGSPVPLCVPAVDPSVPECVPAAGNRVELTFGGINVQQSVNDLGSSISDLGGGLASIPGGDVGGAVGDVPTDYSTPSAPSATDNVFTPPVPSGNASSAGAPATASAPNEVAMNGEQLASASSPRSLGMIGALTAAAAAALLGGILGLVGVVNALATGGRFKFPGLGP
jgi:hypothetical protein